MKQLLISLVLCASACAGTMTVSGTATVGYPYERPPALAWRDHGAQSTGGHRCPSATVYKVTSLADNAFGTSPSSGTLRYALEKLGNPTPGVGPAVIYFDEALFSGGEAVLEAVREFQTTDQVTMIGHSGLTISNFGIRTPVGDVGAKDLWFYKVRFVTGEKYMGQVMDSNAGTWTNPAGSVYKWTSPILACQQTASQIDDVSEDSTVTPGTDANLSIVTEATLQGRSGGAADPANDLAAGEAYIEVTGSAISAIWVHLTDSGDPDDGKTRFRWIKAQAPDPITLNIGSDRVVFDHCEFFAGCDIPLVSNGNSDISITECMAMGMAAANAKTANGHNKAILLRRTAGDPVAENIMFYRNVMAHTDDRQPRIVATTATVINNVGYDGDAGLEIDYRSPDSEVTGPNHPTLNVIGNYYAYTNWMKNSPEFAVEAGFGTVYQSNGTNHVANWYGTQLQTSPWDESEPTSLVQSGQGLAGIGDEMDSADQASDLVHPLPKGFDTADISTPGAAFLADVLSTVGVRDSAGNLGGAGGLAQAIVDDLTGTPSALRKNYSWHADGGPLVHYAYTNTARDELNIVFSEAVTVGAGGNGGFSLGTSEDITPRTLTYLSGDGTTTLTYTIGGGALSTAARPSSNNTNLTYLQPGNGIESVADGTDVRTFYRKTFFNYVSGAYVK